jgi:hypothetical protein
MKPLGATNQPRRCLWCGQSCARPTRRAHQPSGSGDARKYRNVNPDAAEAEVRGFHEIWKDHYGKHNGSSALAPRDRVRLRSCPFFEARACCVDSGVGTFDSGRAQQPQCE